MSLNETKGVRIYADTHRELRTALAAEGQAYTMADAVERLFESAGRKLPPIRKPKPEIRKVKP